MKFNFKKGVLIFFIFLPLIMTLVSLNFLPDLIPAHYGADGEVTRWGSKYESLIIPIIGIVICLISRVYTTNVVKNSDYQRNIKMLNICNTVLVSFFNILTISVLITNFNMITDLNNTFSGKLIYIGFGIGFIILGNYLPKCKRNDLVGIRTSHTLSSDEIWFKTHRFGGKILVIFGFVYTVAALFIPVSIAMDVLIISLLIFTLIISLYAKKLSR